MIEQESEIALEKLRTQARKFQGQITQSLRKKGVICDYQWIEIEPQIRLRSNKSPKLIPLTKGDWQLIDKFPWNKRSKYCAPTQAVLSELRKNGNEPIEWLYNHEHFVKQFMIHSKFPFTLIQVETGKWQLWTRQP